MSDSSSSSRRINWVVPFTLFGLAFLAYVVVILINPGVSNSLIGASALVFAVLIVGAGLLLGAGFALHREDRHDAR